jgi:hypothetical protein
MKTRILKKTEHQNTQNRVYQLGKEADYKSNNGFDLHFLYSQGW